ncbi:uL14 family ribosomal protein [Candidatus Marsarchaeota archaeon]|jgi:large subunit ribosomal protein L14|nr:uL14 family ribosomal protein [Candidatus Marsarchaeota archaeon]MCL5092061.1 uL14 family ribosomal protein [Candidatus Marsarchaeota archaeon]
MKSINGKVSKTLIPGTILTCADNSGAKTLMIINKIGKAGAHGRLATVGVGDIVIASVKSGTPQYIKKKVRAVIIRQKATIRRVSGMRVRFEDNAAILITDTNLPVATEVKGAMAREVVERFIKLAGIASRVI